MAVLRSYVGILSAAMSHPVLSHSNPSRGPNTQPQPSKYLLKHVFPSPPLSHYGGAGTGETVISDHPPHAPARLPAPGQAVPCALHQQHPVNSQHQAHHCCFLCPTTTLCLPCRANVQFDGPHPDKGSFAYGQQHFAPFGYDVCQQIHYRRSGW